MNRLLILIPCVLSSFVLSANAEVISVTATRTTYAEIVNVTATRTTYNATLDQVILRIQSFSGNVVPPSGFVVTNMLGTWTADGGEFNLPPINPPTSWAGRLTNDSNAQDSDGGNADGLSPGVGPTTPQSWLNFSTKTADTAYRSGLVSGSLYNQFHAGYNASAAVSAAYALGPVDYTPGQGESEGYWFDNTLLAVLYVSKATTMSPGQTIFSGTVDYGGAFGGSGSPNVATTVQIVPEPSTLALLCCGLLGLLLSHVWRRRQ